MRTILAAFLLPMLALPAKAQTTPPSPRDSAPPARSTLEALYTGQAQAILRQDVATLMTFNAPDHQVKLLDGDSVSRLQLERGLADFYSSGRLVRQVSFAFEILEATMQSGEAVVLVEQKDHRIQIRADGQPHDVEARVVHRDTWRRTADGWKRHLTEEVRQTKFTVDGKAIVPPEHRTRDKTG